MNTENSSIILAQALEQQNKVMLCMLDALREEHRALSSTDLESFERSVRTKQDQVKILEQTQAQLDALTPILNGKFSKTTIVKYIGKLPVSSQRSQLENLWDTLQRTTKGCSEQNIINNRIMDASSTHLRQVISILRGDLSGPTANVYGASGRQKTHSNGQSLATA